MTQQGIEIRNDMVRALEETSRALKACLSDDDVAFVLGVVGEYKTATSDAVHRLKAGPLGDTQAMMERVAQRLKRFR